MLPSELALRDLLNEGPPEPAEIGWFVARQPGIVGFLERVLGPTDPFAVALEGGYRLCQEMERRTGVPPARVTGSLLERAHAAAQSEARASGAPGPDGVAVRQPELTAWVVDFVAFAAIPLTEREASAASACLAAIVYALDEVVTGRPVP